MTSKTSPPEFGKNPQSYPAENPPPYPTQSATPYANFSQQYTQPTVTVYSNASHYGSMPASSSWRNDNVEDNMVISIVSIFFCCILGVVATVKSMESREAARRGDITKAQVSSRTAKGCAIAAIILEEKSSNGRQDNSITAFKAPRMPERLGKAPDVVGITHLSLTDRIVVNTRSAEIGQQLFGIVDS
ncbi:hypothetical protein RRG08_030778 [Elysia crispata]|uniref:Uncharacterized protein n=1 Tax=Elysia crispata TaxID=231223 RepID=A0AAE0YFD7_9GAST|nr:hypothetical protein RRG08_030778 [Elysia crispata]